MAATKIADMLVPEVWAPYVINKTVEKSLLFQSGIITNLSEDERVDILNAGKTINLPFFSDLTGDDNVIRDDQDITINSIGTGKDVAPVLLREKTFGATDLSAELSGADPMSAIGDRFAAYWTRMYQKALISELAGVMGEVTDNVLNISGLSGSAAVFSGEAFVDAQGKLGDMQDELAAFAVHSATYTLMKKQGLIDFRPDEEGKMTIPTYMGRDLIVDDGMPVSSGVYTAYLFARGAIAYAEKPPIHAAEPGRSPLVNGGTDFIINRKKFLMHTRGVAWQGTPTLTTPSNAELATAGNWDQKYASKQIRVVQFKFRNVAA